MGHLSNPKRPMLNLPMDDLHFAAICLLKQMRFGNGGPPWGSERRELVSDVRFVVRGLRVMVYSANAMSSGKMSQQSAFVPRTCRPRDEGLASRPLSFFMRAGKKRCLGFGFYRDEAPGKPPYLVIKVGPAKKTHPYVAGKPVFSRACPLNRNPERRVDCFTRGKYVSSGVFSPDQRCPPDWERKPGEGC